MDSPLIPTPTPRNTTICPTVILRAGSSRSREEEEELQDDSGGGWKQGLDGVGDSQVPQIITPNNQLSCPSSVETTEVQNDDRSSLVLSVFTGLVNWDHSAGDNLLRMGKSRLYAMEELHRASTTFSEQLVLEPYRQLQFGGGVVFLVHGRDHLCPISLGPSSRKPYGSKDWGLDHRQSTVPICEVNLWAR